MDGLIPNHSEFGLLPMGHLNKLIIFSIMWSVGALLELDDRSKMEAHLKGCSGLDLPVIPEGSNQTIFEYVVDDKGELKLNKALLV